MSIFLFDYPPRKEAFAFELRDPAKIAEARNILAGTPSGGTHVQGKIVKSPVAFNAPWSFHLAPATIDFFEVATEVCDAGIQFVEDNLSQVGGSFLPGNCWCPWGSRLLAELGASTGRIATDPTQPCWRLDALDGQQIHFLNPAEDWAEGAAVTVYFHSLPTRRCLVSDNKWTSIVSCVGEPASKGP